MTDLINSQQKALNLGGVSGLTYWPLFIWAFVALNHLYNYDSFHRSIQSPYHKLTSRCPYEEKVSNASIVSNSSLLRKTSFPPSLGLLQTQGVVMVNSVGARQEVLRREQRQVILTLTLKPGNQLLSTNQLLLSSNLELATSLWEARVNELCR